jgi:hypothetical protein
VFYETARKMTETTLDIRARLLSEAYAEQPAPLREVMQTSPAERSLEQEALFRVHRAQLNIRIAKCNGYRIKPEERAQLDALQTELDKHLGQVVQTRGFYSPVTSPHALSVLPMAGNFPLVFDTRELGSRRAYVFTRGDPYRPQEPLEPGFPAALDGQAPDPDALDRPRTALARWLTSPRNPLTARVWVNRIWAYHFGRGIVATPGNLGRSGAAPTHPELLDYLASELIHSGWSTKHVQRLIVNSNTYRQSARYDAQNDLIDPENQFYWRWPCRRLEAEAMRDMMLAVSGQLDGLIGGPSAPVGKPTARRSLYLFQKRDQPDEMQALFDAPTAMSASCARRQVSTSALQSLLLLNSPSAVALSEAFARRLMSEAPDDVDRQIALAFQVVLGRSPDEDERREATEYLQSAAKESNEPPMTALSRFCQAMLNLNEFLYVP